MLSDIIYQMVNERVDKMDYFNPANYKRKSKWLLCETLINSYMKQNFTLSAIALALMGVTAYAAINSQGARLLLKTEKTQEATVNVPTTPKWLSEDIAKSKFRAAQVPDEPTYSDNLSEIMKEDFSLFAEGSESQRSEEYVAGPNLWNIDPKYTHQPGWTGYGIYQAGGTCALDYPGFGGWLNTPLMNLTGKIVLRFRARPIRPEDTWHGIAVTLLKNPDNPTYADGDCFRYARLNKAEWQEFEFVFENSTVDECFVQFNDGVDRTDEPERLGILIDDVQLLRDEDYVPAPSEVRASDFGNTSFRLSWNAAPGADSYNVNIYEERVSDKPAIHVSENFNDFNVTDPVWPEGWKPVFGSSPIAEGGTDGSLGLAFRTDSDEVDFPSDGISRVESFSCIVYPGKVNPESEAAIYIFGHNPDYDHWGWLQRIYLSNVPAEGLKVVMSAEDDLWLNDAMNISFKDAAEGEYAIVDDIEVVFENAKELVEKKNFDTKETSAVIDGLEPEFDYHYSVCAIKDGKKSAYTERTKAFGVAAPVVKEASDVDRRGAFTANWEATPKATGYVVSLYQTTRIGEDTKGFVVMTEDFNNPKVEVTADPENYEWIPGYDQYLYFDDYTSVPGWYSDGAAVCKGMIGCGSSRYATFNLYSPYMTLNNGNGDFTVEATVWSEKGETFAVQTETEYGTVAFDETGLKKIKVTFHNGKAQQRLMMYTVNGASFFLDDIKVTQDVNNGDLIYQASTQVMTDGNTTSYRFSGLGTESKLYSYSVKALRDFRDESCVSNESAMQLVDLVATAVENIKTANAGFKAYADNGDIVVTAEPDALVRVFNSTGVEISRANVPAEGSVRIPVGGKGIYIVTCNNATVKTAI